MVFLKHRKKNLPLPIRNLWRAPSVIKLINFPLILVVSVYSQIPMMSGNKIIVKNEPSSQSLTMQNIETSSAPITTVESYVKNNLISSATMGKPAISQSTTTYYLDESSSKYIMINRDPYETTELTEGVLDQKEVIIEEM